MSRPAGPVATILILAGVVGGASGAAYFAGEALAYVSLVFGALFFLYAARYYVATISVLLAPSAATANGKNGGNGLKEMNGSEAASPMVSVHLAVYNEERVVDRLLMACSKLDYPNYEVVVVDDSNDGTVSLLKEWILKQLESARPKFKIIHRDNRNGFKGGALNEALRHTDPRAEYVVVLDADFVPDPGLLKKFISYFNLHGPNGNGNGGARYVNGSLAAVQGYQWHALNRAENWLTRGVSCEFSGSYMVDRTFQEVAGTMKMVAGSVYMVRADLLRKHGWSESITEDWELTLRLYENGYKVLYTPLIQAPAECPSTLGKLIRQRMRWAEGHTFNVKRHFMSVLRSPRLGAREKLEFLYFAPYYLQSLFLIVGTLFWFSSDVVFGTRLPFLTAEFGWALVLANLLALPLMSLAGLFLEKRARTDFRGIASQLVLIYALAPYQAYASLKGLLEPAEGSWVRTFKSGKLAGFPGRLEPRKVIKKVLPPRRRSALTPKMAILVMLGVSSLFAATLVHGQLASNQPSTSLYYFTDSPAPQNYTLSHASQGNFFIMRLAFPSGPEASAPIGDAPGDGPAFFSDPAPANVPLPFGASVSVDVWVNATAPEGSGGSATSCNCGSAGNLKFRVDVYDPANNTVLQIPGVGETEVFHLKPGVNEYQASWGHIAQNKEVLKGDTLMVTIWCPDCESPPVLLFNSQSHPSNMDFPIEVPENSGSLIPVAVLIPALGGLLIAGRGAAPQGEKGRGMAKVGTVLIVAGAVIFMTLPLMISFSDLLASAATATGLDRAAGALVPYETMAASDLLRGVGLQAGGSTNALWLAGGFAPVTAVVDWNCTGWQSFLIFGVTCAVGLGDVRGRRWKLAVLGAGVLGVFAVNVLRISLVVALGSLAGSPAALVFHDYGGTIMTLVWLLAFWGLVLGSAGKGPEP